MKQESFRKATPIIKTLHEHNFEAFFVGGAVRDELIGRAINDIDIATSASPDDVMQLFPNAIPVGIEHGTVVVPYDNENYEVTTFRSESMYNDFRHPSHVEFVSSLEEDLKRRDFTMNAIAMTLDGKIIDLFNGQRDIQNCLIRTVGNAEERLGEDPLRMLRALRFASQLDFSLDSHLQLAIREKAELLHHISMERVVQEFDKLIMGKAIKKSFQALAELNLYQQLPFLFDEREMLLYLRELKIEQLPLNIERWSLLILLMEIPNTNLSSFFRKWRFPKQKSDKVCRIINYYRDMRKKPWTDLHIYKMGLEFSISVSRLFTVLKALNEEHLTENDIQQVYDRLPIKNRRDLKCRGDDLVTWLNKNPGPWVNEALQEIEAEIILGELKNKKEDIKRWIKKWPHSNSNS